MIHESGDEMGGTTTLLARGGKTDSKSPVHSLPMAMGLMIYGSSIEINEISTSLARDGMGKEAKTGSMICCWPWDE